MRLVNLSVDHADAPLASEGPWYFGDHMPLILPAAGLQTAYDRVAGPLVDRRDHNWAENETLAAVRDLLLPKLISGQLRIREAEKFAEAVL